MVAQCVMSCSRLHETPHVCDISDKEPNCGGSQLLGVLGVPYFDSDLACSDPPFSRGRHRRITYAFGMKNTAVHV